MAVGILVKFPEGVGAAQYDAVTAQMGFANEPPEGLIFHCAGEPDGRFQVFNVWETTEQGQRFVRERLRPAQVAMMGEERVAAMPEPEMVEIAIHNYLVP